MKEKIAIISMAGKYSKCNSIEDFWEAICRGEELNYTYQRNGEPENYVCRYSKVNDVLAFDYKFFGFTKKEAEIMDPQQRIFIETCYRALKNAGYGDLTKENNIGVFASASVSSYLLNNVLGHDGIDEYMMLMGNDKDFVASKTAYKLNLCGPAVAFQCACSSSLAALHYACLSINNEDCEAALVGGVSISFPQEKGYFYQQGGIKSEDGYCRPFNKYPSGIIKGDGCSVILIKDYKAAVRDNNNILGLISATALNNDAKDKIGYTAPSIGGHIKAIKRCLEQAKIQACDVDYVEAHGTGTLLGDQIEKTVFEEIFKDRKNTLYVGSVKGNVGHLDAAAGMTSVVKCVCMLNKNQIPPTANVKESNFDTEGVIELAQSLLEKTLNCIGISSLGIGGTNAHVILEKYDEADRMPKLNDEKKFNKEICYISPRETPSCSGYEAASDREEKIEEPEEILEELIGIFVEETGEEEINEETECFEIDSMDLVIILDKINKRFKTKLTLSEVTDCNAIKDVAEFLCKKADANFSIIHKFNENKENEFEYFLIHPAGGSVFCYKHLCTEIGSTRNISVVDLPDNYLDYTTMERLAGYYGKEILKKHNPNKKLMLGGYSFGGNLAYELAHQLMEEQVKVQGLVLFDSHPPMAYTALKSKEAIDYDTAFDEIMQGMLGKERLSGLPKVEIQKYLDKWIYCHKLLKSYGKKYSLNMDCVIFRALEKENPKILESLKILSLPKRVEWKLYIKGETKFIDVKGNHYSMLDDPEFAKELADKFLEECK